MKMSASLSRNPTFRYFNSVLWPKIRNLELLNAQDVHNLIVIILSTFSIGMICSIAVSYAITGVIIKKAPISTAYHASVKNNVRSSYSILQKNILSRNILNRNGELPYEDTPEGTEEFFLKNFDKLPCSYETLPIEMVGVIYTDNPAANVVSLKDPKAEIADAYKEGQNVIDYESYILHKVSGPTQAQFRHDKQKICVTLNGEPSGTISPSGDLGGGPQIILEGSFVSSQLGVGFTEILNKARLVPEIIDGKTTGFRIFAISTGCLFDKIGLVDGDILKEINGVSLEDSSQGYRIYQAFQEETQIHLKIERNHDVLTKRVVIQ